MQLLRPLLLQQPVAPNNLERCYSLSTKIIDISFAHLFIRRNILVTYSWKDICDIILAGVTFLYIISTSTDVIEDDASSLSRQSAKLTAILKIILENWPNAARAQQLLLNLVKYTMNNTDPREADDRSEGEQQRLSKRPKITPDTHETHEVSYLPCPDDFDSIDLPLPRAKVRRDLAHRDSQSEAQHNDTNNGLRESFFDHEFVGRHRVSIMSILLGISSPQTEGEHGVGSLCDDMNSFRSFLEFVDALHGATGP